MCIDHRRIHVFVAEQFLDGSYIIPIYQQGTAVTMPLEGSFCIEGNKMYVRYFKRRFMPDNLRLSEMAIEFGTKIKPLGEDLFIIKELDEKRMILLFSSDSKEHVFYRKN